MVFYILAELRNLLALLDIVHGVLFGLFCHYAVVGLNFLHVVDVLVTLEDVNFRWFAFLVWHIVGGHLIVIRAKFLQNAGVTQPPVFMCHTHRRVPPDARFYTLTDVACQRQFVERLQGRVDALTENVPPCHAGELLLVGVQLVVPLITVTSVVCHQLVPTEIFLVLVEFVGLVAHFLVLLTPLALAVETANALVVLVDHAALLRTVQRLGILFL